MYVLPCYQIVCTFGLSSILNGEYLPLYTSSLLLYYPDMWDSSIAGRSLSVSHCHMAFHGSERSINGNGILIFIPRGYETSYTQGRERLFFWGKESSTPGLFRVISGVLQNKSLNSSEEI